MPLCFFRFQSEVRLSEDYDVYISKAQLDSILVNYTRSGSLLFRKLVGAISSLILGYFAVMWRHWLIKFDYIK